jgi:hypothetical protein
LTISEPGSGFRAAFLVEAETVLFFVVFEVLEDFVDFAICRAFPKREAPLQPKPESPVKSIHFFQKIEALQLVVIRDWA